ncbi:MAG: hypothetical protein JXB47_11710 [Anaerolineae bacterium]|nr:hypothetical protein [Anaerolineae bacterium]
MSKFDNIDREAGKTLFTLFGTPLKLRPVIWFPLYPLVMWPALVWAAGKHRPERSRRERLAVGALRTAIPILSEWCHNYAHAAAAQLAGAPMDELWIMGGTPRVIYYDYNNPDQAVAPRQHITRALGGPVFNLLVLLPLSLLWRARTKPGTLARELADTAVQSQLCLGGAGTLPVPFLDGGPALKWGLVMRGRTPEAAFKAVQRANWPPGILLALAGLLALKRRRWIAAALALILAVASIGSALGLMKE